MDDFLVAIVILKDKKRLETSANQVGNRLILKMLM